MTCGKPNTALEIIIVTNTFGHFTMDLLYMKYKGFLDMGNLIHHCLGLSTYWLPVFTPTHGYLMSYIMWPGEWSNVAMHFREIFKMVGLRYTKTFYLNEKYYFYSYIFGRTVVYGYVYFNDFFTCSPIWTLFKIVYPLHMLQSLYYMRLKVKILGHRSRELKKIRDAKMTLTWTVPLDAAELEKIGVKSVELFQS